eukprot:SRR837773.7028.p2 GENE.SRR837773.7028~~SRR837773.7028.p2  ORF type:complete len:178 (-),score=51.15 SRR837773.7028:48-542(-)
MDPPFYMWAEAADDRHSRSGLEHSLEYVFSHIASNGPYEGLYGFSNGAVIATLATEVLERAQASGDDARLRALGSPAPWRFVISACGSCLFEESEGDATKLRTPSLHLVGGKDPIRDRSLRLMKMYESPDSYEMTYAGHCITIQCSQDLELRNAMKLFLSKLRA